MNVLSISFQVWPTLQWTHDFILPSLGHAWLDKNSMFSGTAQGPVKSIFAIVLQKGHESKPFSANHKPCQVF